MKILRSIIPIFLVFVSIVIAMLYVYISLERPLSALEGVLLQIFALVAGIAGSFLLGRNSVADAAKEMIKPHARSAFRRLVSLYEGLSRLAYAIESAKEKAVNKETNELMLEKFEAIVVEQLSTADDSLEDWGDIVPDEIEELKNRLKPTNNSGEVE